MAKCLIIGAGDFNEKNLVKNKGDLIIAADGGLKYLMDLNIYPDIVVGDMDSLENKELLNQQLPGTEIRILPKMKDDTDMLAAIRIGLDKGYVNFEIFGALGGRLDHSLANIQCLKFIKNHQANAVINDGRRTLRMISNEILTLEKNKKGTISVFAYGGDAIGVTEKGLKYEVKDVLLSTDYPVGVSNEFTGEESSVEVKNGCLLIYIEEK